MKVLIAIESCHQYWERRKAQSETWAQGIVGANLRFFVGRVPQIPGKSFFPAPDTIMLDVDDGYRALPSKTQAICRWALAEGYDYVFKCDDDTYVQVDRLLASGFEQHDYIGRVRGPSGIFRAPYCSGLGYWLSRKAMQIVADTPLNGDDAEDRFVGNALHEAGISPHPDYHYAVVESTRNASSALEGPRQGNRIIAACEFHPGRMHEIHREWLHRPSQVIHSKSASGKLSRVTVLIKTFLRDNYLLRCVRGIETRFPEMKMVIVDDGVEARPKITLYARLRDQGHVCLWLPYDSGFGAKANAAIPHCADDLFHPFVLIASDDFDFETPGLREGMEKMVTVLERDPSIDIVSGRVNGKPYEACLEDRGMQVIEKPGWRDTREVEGVVYHPCDLTVNFSMMRRTVLGLGEDKLHWDGAAAVFDDGETVKIGGGEHGAFFLDAKCKGFGVAYVEGANIREYPPDLSQMHPMYPQCRKRARKVGRPCLKLRGVKRWQLQDGTWETC